MAGPVWANCRDFPGQATPSAFIHCFFDQPCLGSRQLASALRLNAHRIRLPQLTEPNVRFPPIADIGGSVSLSPRGAACIFNCLSHCTAGESLPAR